MARYQLIFRDRSGDRKMLVDDPTIDDEPAYLRQPLKMGAAIRMNGTVWVVAEDSDDGELRRIVCHPEPANRTVEGGQSTHALNTPTPQDAVYPPRRAR